MKYRRSAVVTSALAKVIRWLFGRLTRDTPGRGQQRKADVVDSRSYPRNGANFR